MINIDQDSLQIVSEFVKVYKPIIKQTTNNIILTLKQYDLKHYIEHGKMKFISKICIDRSEYIEPILCTHPRGIYTSGCPVNGKLINCDGKYSKYTNYYSDYSNTRYKICNEYDISKLTNDMTEYFNINLFIFKHFYNSLKDLPTKYLTQLICTYAVGQTATDFEYVPNKFKTNKLCHACATSPHIDEFDYNSYTAWLQHVKQTNLLKYVPQQFRTYELCAIAVKNNNKMIIHIPDKLKTYKFYMETISINYLHDCMINYIPLPRFQ